jgi:hypothetical protein
MINSAWLEKMLAEMKLERPKLDRRGQGAFVVGRLSWAIGLVLASSHLVKGKIPNLALDSVCLLEEGEQMVLVLKSGKVVPSNEWHETREILLALLAPVVERIRELTQLSNAPQWRMISDSIALAFNYVGDQLQLGEKARVDVLSLLHGEKTPLQNKKTNFLEVVMQDPADKTCKIQRTFVRTRAGCCRKYTDDSEYCDTCVHRSIDEQRFRVERSIMG